ncbi:hypothetical protein DY000_02042566 [Brassica cretica]|uniref:Transmembrane protein n=1 Tax=Brassica cretica TaxID=69181 RepID=A0ABQ7BGV0_BRACR|nr:hypothetical protein DY000_02042566 [Brassica cretica]
MRRVESTIKVQWQVLVGIEGCLHRRLRILTFLESVYALVMLVCVRSTSMIFSSGVICGCVLVRGVTLFYLVGLWFRKGFVLLPALCKTWLFQYQSNR